MEEDITIELIRSDFNSLNSIITYNSNKEVITKALGRIYNTSNVTVSPGHVSVTYTVDSRLRIYLNGGPREVDRCRRELYNNKPGIIKVISITPLL